MAQRISEITDTTEVDQWQWVPTRENPDNDLSRGISAQRLQPDDRWFGGPDYLRQGEVGPRHEKQYGALFTCLANRAVHVERADDMSTHSTLMAIGRFISRRGCPLVIHSHNGTNFKGAAKELCQAIRELNEAHIQDQLSHDGITWSVNLPPAPHIGGAWERLIGSIKTVLHAIIKERHPRGGDPPDRTGRGRGTREQSTSHTCHSGCRRRRGLDSKPFPDRLLMCHTSRNRAGRRCLAAAPMARCASPCGYVLAPLGSGVPTDSRSPHKVEPPSEAARRNDIVIIAAYNTPRGLWLKGVISAIHPGCDGVVRVVHAKTASGSVFRPPAAKNCVLDVRS